MKIVKPLIAAFIILIVFTSADAVLQKQSVIVDKSDSLNRICIAGTAVGAITATTSEKDLIRIYGKENVKRSNIDEGEGYLERGTTLFQDNLDELKIIWKDTLNFKNPKCIYVKTKKSNWKTNTGITIGTSLKQLELINTKPFIMLGLGWDYSGFVYNWNNGTLGKDNTELKIRLRYNKKHKLTQSEFKEVMGDKEIVSSNKIVQKLNLNVVELIFFFNNK